MAIQLRIHITLCAVLFILPVSKCMVYEIHNDNLSSLSILPHVSFIKEDSVTFTIRQLLHEENNARFQNNSGNGLNFGFSRLGAWLKIDIVNHSDERDFIFSFPNGDLQYLGYYETAEGIVLDSSLVGKKVRFGDRRVQSRSFAFDISLPKGEQRTYYFYAINHHDALNVPITLHTLKNFFYSEINSLLFLGVFYGIALFIVIFTFYLFFALRGNIYLYYGIHVASYYLYIFIIDGFAAQYLWPEMVNWINDAAAFLLASLSIISVVFFIKSFLSINASRQYVNGIFNGMAILAAACFLISLYPPFIIVAAIGYMLAYLATVFLAIFLLFTESSKGYFPNRFFLSGLIVLLLGIVIYVLHLLGILKTNIITVQAVRIGILLQSIIITIAVLERFRIQQVMANLTIEDNYQKIELQNHELELINNELEKLSIVASEISNSVSIFDRKGMIEWCNSAFEKFYETTIAEIALPRKGLIEEVIPNQNIKEFFFNVIFKKQPFTFQTSFVSRSNKVKWAQTTLSPLVKSGKVSKIIAVDSDITLLKEYEIELEKSKEKAEDADKLKTAFLGNMSHEIRTPLNGILGFAELLRTKDLPDEKKDKFLKLIMSNGDQLIRIIDDIVDISLIESNQLKIYPIDFSVNQLITELVESFEIHKQQLNKTNIEIIRNMNIQAHEDIIRSDPHRIKQVLSNLIKNSLKFTSSGYIKLGCYINQSNLMLYVEDTGIGIEPDKREFVFERFRQVDESLTRKYGGSGLGLSISKGIIEKMNGKIWLDPHYDKGLRVCFIVPSIVSEINLLRTKHQTATDKLAEKLEGKQILIVEDHDISFEYLSEILSAYNVKIKRAINGRQAINLAKKEKYDMILMDINLPEMDGMATTRAIREFDPDLPIIAQTAYALDSEKNTILASGCNDIICKPINSKELLALIVRFFSS